MATPTKSEKSGLTALELNSIISLAKVAHLRGCSVDTIERNESEKIIKISERRRGMRLRHALMLDEESQ
jgi:hypothetical protein